MNVSVLLAHPSPASFNHAIAQTAVSELAALGHAVILHDLYAEAFDPLLPAMEIPSDGPIPESVVRHCEEIASADGIVIVHPNWWGQPPAVLKGWIDRVIRPGIAYNFVEGDAGDGVPVGLLHAKWAVVFNTSNTSPDREQAVFGDPLELIWKRCVFGLCGVYDVCRVTFAVVATSDEGQRARWLERVREVVRDRFGFSCVPSVPVASRPSP